MPAAALGAGAAFVPTAGAGRAARFFRFFLLLIRTFSGVMV
jgi:hypothetical protein